VKQTKYLEMDELIDIEGTEVFLSLSHARNRTMSSSARCMTMTTMGWMDGQLSHSALQSSVFLLLPRTTLLYSTLLYCSAATQERLCSVSTTSRHGPHLCSSARVCKLPTSHFYWAQPENSCTGSGGIQSILATYRLHYGRNFQKMSSTSSYQSAMPAASPTMA